MFKKVKGVYFSGTGTTEKIVNFCASKIANDTNLDLEIIDFTKPENRREPLVFSKEDMVVFGMPVIAGRVQNLMLKYLNKIEGGHAICMPVVLYGNRNFDDGLIELRDILEERGLKCLCAGAFVGEHSFSKVLGAGRPDREDFKLAEELALKFIEISKKIEEGWVPEAHVLVPGFEKPYREYYKPKDRYGNHIDIRKVKPKTDKNKCQDCKLCVTICPLGSIDYEDVSKIEGICMKCCGCIKKCPNGAKYFDDPGYIYHKEELEEMYQSYSKSQIFSGEV